MSVSDMGFCSVACDMVFIYHDGRVDVTVRLLCVAWNFPVRGLTATAQQHLGRHRTWPSQAATLADAFIFFPVRTTVRWVGKPSVPGQSAGDPYNAQGAC